MAHKNKTSERIVSARRKADPSIVTSRPKPVPQFIVIVRWLGRNGQYKTGACVNMYQDAQGHPAGGVLMSWRAAEYTKRVLQGANPGAKYTIHAVRAALQKEPKI